MYLEHFGLSVNPFGLSPRLEFLYKSGAFEESMAHLVYGLDQSEAIILITGAIGTGKTMAINSFLTHLGRSFESALVTNTKVTATELLKLILDDLEVEFPVGCDKSDLLILFKGEMSAARERGQRIVIVVDEAQNLAVDVLEEIRLLTNLGQGESQPVQIVLVGQPELEDLVNRPDLAQLRQRIRVHYRLDPLTRSEMEAYINHRMSIAGCTTEIFETQCLDRIYELCSGVPRVVNTLAGEALLSAFVDGRQRVLARDVELGSGGDQAKEVPVWEDVAPLLSNDTEALRPSPANAPQAPVDEVKPAPEVSGPTVDPVYGQRHRRPGRRSRERRALLWMMGLVVIVVGGTLLLASQGLLTLDFARFRSSESQHAIARTGGGTVNPSALPTGSMQASRRSGISPAVAAHDSSGPGGVVKHLAGSELRQSTTDGPIAVSGSPTHEVEPLLPYAVHISSFHDVSRATALVNRLRAEGHSCFIQEHKIKDSLWRRVYLGPFATKAVASSAAHEYASASGSQYYKIVQVSNDVGNK